MRELGRADLTPAMVEAGVAELRCYNPNREPDEYTVERIYAAMMARACEEWEDEHPCGCANRDIVPPR